MDSVVLSQLAAEGGKRVFGRPRPRDNADPNVWFGRGRSFPSGEASGWLAHRRGSPFFLGLLPDGVGVGVRSRF